jgi:hypothetical protein
MTRSSFYESLAVVSHLSPLPRSLTMPPFFGRCYRQGSSREGGHHVAFFSGEMRNGPDLSLPNHQIPLGFLNKQGIRMVAPQSMSRAEGSWRIIDSERVEPPPLEARNPTCFAFFPRTMRSCVLGGRRLAKYCYLSKGSLVKSCSPSVPLWWLQEPASTGRS